MRILFVAMSNSIHTARWIRQISEQGWDIHLVPTDTPPLHPYLQGIVTVHTPKEIYSYTRQRRLADLLARWPIHRGSGHVRRLRERLLTKDIPIYGLDRLISQLKPDIVHSMELQHAAYKTIPSKWRMGDSFPTWVVSNWGSDIYLFGKLVEHTATIKQVMALCDYYACECVRDVVIAKQYGLKGKVLPVLPCGGGFDLETLQSYRHPGPISERKVILIKGAQGWAGRSLVALRAIELCADLLQDYRIVMQLPSPDSELAARLLSHTMGMPIEIAYHGDYMEAVRRFGSARIHIGLSISDGISQSLIESMVMGAFPIQSHTACADEWVVDGENGFIVPPEDSFVVAEALRRALTDDDLVNRAAQINTEIAQKRLAYALVKEKVVGMYKSIIEESSQ